MTVKQSFQSILFAASERISGLTKPSAKKSIFNDSADAERVRLDQRHEIINPALISACISVVVTPILMCFYVKFYGAELEKVQTAESHLMASLHVLITFIVVLLGCLFVWSVTVGKCVWSYPIICCGLTLGSYVDDGHWQFYALAFIVSSVAGGLELYTKFREEPSVALNSRLGLCYIAANGLIGSAALGLVNSYPQFYANFGFPGLPPKVGEAAAGAPPTAAVYIGILIIAASAMVIMRSRAFTIGKGDNEIAIGPDLAIKSVMDFITNRIDDKRIHDRWTLVDTLMHNIDFNKAIPHIRAIVGSSKNASKDAILAGLGKLAERSVSDEAAAIIQSRDMGFLLIDGLGSENFKKFCTFPPGAWLRRPYTNKEMIKRARLAQYDDASDAGQMVLLFAFGPNLLVQHLSELLGWASASLSNARDIEFYHATLEDYRIALTGKFMSEGTEMHGLGLKASPGKFVYGVVYRIPASTLDYLRLILDDQGMSHLQDIELVVHSKTDPSHFEECGASFIQPNEVQDRSGFGFPEVLVRRLEAGLSRRGIVTADPNYQAEVRADLERDYINLQNEPKHAVDSGLQRIPTNVSIIRRRPSVPMPENQQGKPPEPAANGRATTSDDEFGETVQPQGS